MNSLSLPKNKPVIPVGFEIPEYQLKASNYPIMKSPVIGNCHITGGFMENCGHSLKPSCVAIFKDGQGKTLLSAHRNLGIDYVLENNEVLSWYSGLTQEINPNLKGYGNQVVVRYDVFVPYDNASYQLYGAYSHLANINVASCQRLRQGQPIGIQGNTGGNYPLHVDYRCYIKQGDKKIDVSPNYVEKMMFKK